MKHNPMQKPLVCIGLGELAGVFVRGLLKQGIPIVPVTRKVDMASVARDTPDPLAILVTVAEKDIDRVLAAMPDNWRHKLILVQNELLPDAWSRHQIVNPTIISVWFEKKPGQEFKVIIPSPVFGPNSRLVVDALNTLGIPARELANENDLLFELVVKNVYILTTNIAGIETGGTVADLWNQHRKIARAVAEEIIDIQFSLVHRPLDREALIGAMQEAINGDPDHQCVGRSAVERLERILKIADEAGLVVKKLREIRAQC